jgi:hypothetical protein
MSRGTDSAITVTSTATIRASVAYFGIFNQENFAMRVRNLGLFAAATLLLPTLGWAEPFSYRYVDAALLFDAEVELGDTDVDGDGIQLRASIPVNETFFVIGEFQTLDFDFGIDTNRLAVGGGGHWALSDVLDIVARIGLVREEVEAGNFDDDDTGLFAGARGRFRPGPQFEVEAGVELVDLDAGNLNNDVFIVGEGRYNFNSQWAAGATLSIGDDSTQLGLYGRYNF